MIITSISIILGAAIGWLIHWLDLVAYIYILHPEAQISQYIRYQVDRRQYRQALGSLKTRMGEVDKLTTRGILFQLAWIVLAFFAVTSSAGWFGKTLVLTLGGRILYEQWREYFSNRVLLKKKLLWQIKLGWNEGQVKLYLIGFTLVFAWLLRLYI